MLTCIVWIILAVVIAGVLVWAMQSLPLDPTIQSIGKVAIVVLFVVFLVVIVMNCLGVGVGLPGGHHPVVR